MLTSSDELFSGFKPLRSGALDRTLPRALVSACHDVSNPFVAGHWIVPDGITDLTDLELFGFKPLRSGALDRTLHAVYSDVVENV